jgi:Asp-tRNA(Asn)/Glu-tRNA(Gln) amidotransferase B subunit
MARDDLPPSPDYLVTILTAEPHNLSVEMAKRLSLSSSEVSYYNSVTEIGKSLDRPTICNWYKCLSFGILLICRLVYQLLPLLRRSKIPLEESPFTVEHMAELLTLLQKGIINGNSVCVNSLIFWVVDGGKLLLAAYLPPNNPPNISVYQHPLIETFSNRDAENARIHQNVIEIITSTVLHEKIRGMDSLQRLYMGELMGRRKGKVDVNLALEIIKKEMAKRLVFEPVSPGSKFLRVRHRSDEETK